MMRMTSISIKEKTWLSLNRLKKPGDTMDDVITKILDFYNTESNDSTSEQVSDEDFASLVDDLIVDTKEFDDYLEKSRLSFSR
jgi:hypothetical protein